MGRQAKGGRSEQVRAGALRYRAPGASLALAELLRRALPGLDAERDVRLARGAVAVDGVVHARSAGERIAPGCRIDLACPDPEQVLLDAAPARAAALALQAGSALRALVLAPPWPSGELEAAAGRLRFEVCDCRGAVAELRLDWQPAVEPGVGSGDPGVLAVLGLLASLGHPVIGDGLGGGVLAAGGLRLAPLAAEPPPDWWPAEPVALGRSPRAGGEPPRFAISSESARVLERGHPWVLRDADSGDVGRHRPGSLVRLETASGSDAGLALVDGEGERVASRWAAAGERAASIEARVEAALERRAALFASEGTDAFRLVHGEADGLPGLAIDRLGSALRVLVVGRSALLLREAAREAAARGMRERTGLDAAVIEVVHLRRPAGAKARLVCARLVAGELEPQAEARAGRLVVRERGLRFAVDPGLADPTRSVPAVGLFLDQRENRARLAKLARRAPEGSGGRWLNLFAHTGAFSAALLAAGARAVVSVDLSARYLRWLEDNLALNRDLGVDPGHHTTVRREGRRFLDELAAGERFAGIVLDPPTAAAAGRHYWSIRKDLQPLIEASLEHLEDAGWLLVARNDRAARGPSLRAAVEAAAKRARVALRAIEPARPGRDFPSLRGFPEGDPFRALLVQREGPA
jgi:23S rRNA (cytosine1962-C5)-methyltransferase